MSAAFFIAWGAEQGINDSLQRYPGLCFTLVVSPGAPDLVLGQLFTATTFDAVVVGTRADSPEYWLDSGLVDGQLLSELVDGTQEELRVEQTIVDGSRVWRTIGTPADEPNPAFEE